MNRDKFFIGGDWVDPASSDQLAVISPHTEEVIAKVPEATTADVDRAVAAAREAFDNGPWPQMSPAERADVIAAISAGIQARYEEMARTISEEMGSPITWATILNSGPEDMQRSRARRAGRRSGIDQAQGLRFRDAIAGDAAEAWPEAATPKRNRPERRRKR